MTVNVIDMLVVLVILDNVPAMSMIQVAVSVTRIHHVVAIQVNAHVTVTTQVVMENVIVIVHAVVTQANVPAMDMMLDAENVILTVHVVAIQEYVLVMDTILDVVSATATILVVVIQYVVMIVQQIMVNVL